MSKIEIIMFSYFMKPGNIYFEFGSGGSTNIASYYKIKTYSVESDIQWHQKLKRKYGQEAVARELVIIGVEGILSGLNPKVIEEKLSVFMHK